MHQADFRIKHHSVYAKVTANTSVKFQMLCNDHCDILYLQEPEDEEGFKAIESLVGVKDKIIKDGNAVIITNQCLLNQENDLLENYLESHDCLSLPPWTYENGELAIRIVALDKANLSSLYHDLQEDMSVEVEALREIRMLKDPPFISFNADFPELSPRQQEALLIGSKLGYFETPRKTTTEDIGAAMGINRRTAEEHLRRAEKKIVNSYVNGRVVDK